MKKRGLLRLGIFLLFVNFLINGTIVYYILSSTGMEFGLKWISYFLFAVIFATIGDPFGLAGLALIIVAILKKER